MYEGRELLNLEKKNITMPQRSPENRTVNPLAYSFLTDKII